MAPLVGSRFEEPDVGVLWRTPTRIASEAAISEVSMLKV